jgi:hypothetical protein
LENERRALLFPSVDDTHESFGIAPAYAPRTSAQHILDAISVKAQTMELSEAEPWKSIEFGRWGPTTDDHFPAALKKALAQKVSSE